MSSSWDELTPEEDVDLKDLGSTGLSDPFSEMDFQKLEEISEPVTYNFRPPKVPKLSVGRVCMMVFVGIIVSMVIFIFVGAMYTRFIRFPNEQKRVWEESILYAVENFCDDVNSMEVDLDDSYLMREIPYANDNKDREAFMRYVLKSVSYITDIVNKKNVYGNDFVDKDTMEIATENSWLEEGEEATVSFIDYSSIEFDSEIVKDLISKCELTPDDIRYQDKLTDMYCQYIYGIDIQELPVKSERHVPNVSWNGVGYSVDIEEDIYLDRILYSSDALYGCFERFAELVANELGMTLEVSQEYSEWEGLSEANRESAQIPLKYGKNSIGHIWCGAYYLIEEYVGKEDQGGLIPQLGDGSKDQPASIDTPVITYIIQTNSDGEEVKLPIQVTMKEFGVSQKAIDWFEKKDVQNRGYNVTSEVQYCYYVFEVVNLSKEVLTVYDNSALCDDNANSSGRTGTVYGLQDKVTLNPGESGVIESWNRSTELNMKYVIWGNDFARRAEPVWFRVLAGDLEDPTVEKGVSLNTTRK